MEILMYFGNEIYRYLVEIASLTKRSEKNHVYHIYIDVRGFSLNENNDHDSKLLCRYFNMRLRIHEDCSQSSVSDKHIYSFIFIMCLYFFYAFSYAKSMIQSTVS